MEEGGKKWRTLGDRWDRIDRSISRGEGVKIERFGEWPGSNDRGNKSKPRPRLRYCTLEICSSSGQPLFLVPPRYQGSRWWKLTRRDAPLIGNRIRWTGRLQIDLKGNIGWRGGAGFYDGNYVCYFIEYNGLSRSLIRLVTRKLLGDHGSRKSIRECEIENWKLCVSVCFGGIMRLVSLSSENFIHFMVEDSLKGENW